MLIETQKYRGYFFEIHTDEDPQNPREECDNLGTMACWHQRYNLGDIKWDKDTARAAKAAEKGGGISLPLFLYDHSGLTMNTIGFSCNWDSGQVGFYYATREQICEWNGWSRLTKARHQQAREQMVSQVETYDWYLRGACYGFVIEAWGESCW